MLKKVLSVVLALVLALGVCAIAVSAATSSQLQSVLKKLPSEYNAQFYNDDTKAQILEARAAAEAALESGITAEITAAWNLCNDAIDAAYDGEDQYAEAIDDYMWVYTNRDESKAVADIYYSTDIDGALKEGDTFDVTISVKTNFYVRTMNIGFAYDSSKFEFVEDSDTYPAAVADIMDTTTTHVSTTWGRSTTTGAPLAGGYPDDWSADKVAQYNLLQKSFIYKTGSFFYPAEKTDVITLTMKVKDGALTGVDSAEAKIFADNELCATVDNYLLGSYEKPLFFFTRAYAPTTDETVADMEGTQKMAKKVTDEQATCGQTFNFHDADMTIALGETVTPLDYTALEAAVASIAGYKAADWTDASWKAFADAVDAGNDELTDKTAATQEEIDAFTSAIVAKREALEAFVQDSLILDITEVTTPVVGNFTTLDVLVEVPEGKKITKLQFVNAANSTLTYARDYERVLGIKDNGDGTETWTIKIMVYKVSETYNVFPKVDSVWSTKGYRYILADTHEYDGNIYSYEIPDAKDARIKLGRHDIIVETGIDVTKVQVAYWGTTATFTANNSTFVEKDGRLFWTINFNFCKCGDAQQFVFYSRTAKQGFTKSDVTAVVDILL